MFSDSQNSLWSNLSAAILAILLSTILSFPSHASDSKLGSMDDFWEKYDDIADWITIRLKLTPEQEDKVLPLLEKNFEVQMAIMEEYGIKPDTEVPKLTREQKEEIDAKVIAVRAATRAEVIKVLEKEQLQELKAIQREYHEELRERLAEN
ncbi:hypothetical protein HXX02_03680 [Microbulbifer elongatus]|uniref:LTXXQ motif family protein n=1 Tax=Microbulbifer elongatus TaxID=86173 RepID=A0ABT1NXC1_9GAMM|nr:hypothetical protein [Microbulbifer elongatus]MCQ3828533.1 hypothetical protein [Microbulbifer elongatus]